MAGTGVMMLVAGVLSVAGVVAVSTALAPVASATTPGTPGTPQAPSTIYQEDFQNRPGPSPIVRLSGYTGTSGQTYTANAAWLTNCNGWIASAAESITSAAQVADCAGGQQFWNQSQQLAQSIGMFHGQTAAAATGNYADTAFTSGNPGVGNVEFQTATNIPFIASDRFLAFRVDVAAINCAVSGPLLQFSLLNTAGTATAAGGQINACTSTTTESVPALGNAPAATINVGTYTSNGSVLFTGTSVGIRMVNNNGSGTGNDHTFDNVQILDVTPQLDKSFSPTSVKTGGTSTLTFTITNTTDLSAKNGWSFTDSMPAGLTVAAPAATTTCPAGVVTAPAGGTTATVTGNLSAGMASCTVTVTVTSNTAGTYTNGPGNVTESGLNPPGSSSVTFSNPSLAIVKHAAVTDVNGDGLTDAGDTIAYTFTVTNTGDVAMSNIAVADAKAGAVTCPTGPLAVGASTTCTADNVYTVTAADVTAGAVDNSATASGTPPGSTTPITSTPSTTHTPTTAANPAITVAKTATPLTLTAAGQTVAYSFLVTNTGNVTLTDVHPTETAFSGTGTAPTITCPAGAASLAPGESVTCTATYTATQADADAGTVTNTATATGTPPAGDTPPVSEPSTVVVTITPNPAITVAKTATPLTLTAAGQTVAYSFLVTNTGNVTLTDVHPTETAFSGTGTAPTITCPAGAASLAPGASVTCTATYTATQADADAGAVTNTATATGTPPAGDTPPVSEPSTVVVTITPNPAITMVKSADPSDAAHFTVGQVITYSFVITNAGNVTLTNVTPTEGTFTGAGTMAAPTCPAGAASLAPGAQVTCTATYTLTQADVDAGSVTNDATATGTPPPGDTPPVSQPSTVTIPSNPNPAISLVKSATPSTITAAGQTVTYSFLVTNTGNVTLTGANVTDTAFTGTGTPPTITCPNAAATMAPGQSVTCTATYVATQADVDAGTITNTATATATPPPGNNPPVSEPSTATVTITPNPAISVVKSATPATITAAGQTVTYSFLVTNTGNVTLADATVTDTAFTGTGTPPTITCPAGAASLAPGESVTCTATYVATQADVDAGLISNTATASATPPPGDTTPVSPPSTAVVTATGVRRSPW
ncbi:conserved repeat domain-containing protein [Nakamurella panacisegetis]|uniref:Conserved repeat domain-containing protein n=2 Tax=Nakamurella panacisegetis TaxID=1090615 RepID=A0A1H0LJ68_9ACTN|nr:conserved repeat domain-containing protein [Nakamurella panacisegetis]